jgi:sterol desaturase/sphingolipid hydroxylase (fatty acid hydroxylase superfamily)
MGVAGPALDADGLEALPVGRQSPVVALNTVIAGLFFMGGVAPLAVVAFEILLNATVLFNHSDVQMPVSLDRVLRWFVMTPDMHRIHHSVDVRETNSNYGFNVPWRDRLFGAYCAEPP